jgi:uncharacterized SAM-binding protein YcdF (DUF218 family)
MLTDAHHRQTQVSPKGGAIAPARPLRTLAGLAVYLCGLCAILFATLLFVGFIWFALAVPDREITTAPKADGIVVLTGGSSRIADGIELLSQKRGGRMLISGVNRKTTVEELVRQTPIHADLYACCIDVGYLAENTIGNAIEARRWVETRNLDSILLVTSAYHMRRAEAEFARQMPDVKIIPFPVISESLALNPWWSSLETTRLLFAEYLKYIVALARMRLEDSPPAALAVRSSPAAGS